MSAASVRYHALPRSALAALTNRARSGLRYLAPWHDAYPPYARQYFVTFGMSFTARSAYDLARDNFAYQSLSAPPFTHQQLAFAVPEFSFTGAPDFPIDPLGLYDPGMHCSAYAAYLFNYPKPYSRPRRSYWTGAPRRRRNRV